MIDSTNLRRQRELVRWTAQGEREPFVQRQSLECRVQASDRRSETANFLPSIWREFFVLDFFASLFSNHQVRDRFLQVFQLFLNIFLLVLVGFPKLVA